jgi:hypothetical protein
LERAAAKETGAPVAELRLVSALCQNAPAVRIDVHHAGVQAETISALVASGAAVLGVPAALVVGLRQARAARHAAEVAATSTREQWRKTHVREAAIAFVGHAEHALSQAARLAPARGLVDLSELTAAREALWQAQAMIRIEGPEQLSDLAREAHMAVEEFVIPVLVQNAERRPRLLLEAAARAGNRIATEFIDAMRRNPSASVLETACWVELAESDLLLSDDLAYLESLLKKPRVHGDRPSPESTFIFARDALNRYIGAVQEHLNRPPGE